MAKYDKIEDAYVTPWYFWFLLDYVFNKRMHDLEIFALFIESI